jgi:hypothetical protein
MRGERCSGLDGLESIRVLKVRLRGIKQGFANPAARRCQPRLSDFHGPAYLTFRGPLAPRRPGGPFYPSSGGAMTEALILVALAAILIFVILDDLRNYRIRNEAVAALAALFLLRTVLRGRYQEALCRMLPLRRSCSLCSCSCMCS